jgi:hypothetical protein
MGTNSGSLRMMCFTVENGVDFSRSKQNTWKIKPMTGGGGVNGRLWCFA